MIASTLDLSGKPDDGTYKPLGDEVIIHSHTALFSLSSRYATSRTAWAIELSSTFFPFVKKSVWNAAADVCIDLHV